MTEPIHPDTCEQQQPRGSRVLKAAPQRDKWNAGITQDLLSQGEMASNTAKEAGTLSFTTPGLEALGLFWTSTASTVMSLRRQYIV